MNPLKTCSIFGIGVFMITTGCDDDPVDGSLDAEISAEIEMDDPLPNVGDQVTLDASNSDVSGAEDVTYEWNLDSSDGFFFGWESALSRHVLLYAISGVASQLINPQSD